uniref:Uncharacterized protein n=1 Tax=Chromera velia CCMP2878 TaxID=1169474 RepID=A0A0G4I7E0_9ALVE|eukprot:Cvel_11577.t1-p1 / transcript=Cvel_11577.t1 / gene=Cvel_11577 / organism=Chromera_velia_CCMP2878 / gene_product=hypothetical protein / transcript_product=hypothetical protein / location=Cvel_scaffold732:18260-18879(-) / protein_length=128 / sequence_SO=supercontig / SO=protein_coding / is_pseudo=false
MKSRNVLVSSQGRMTESPAAARGRTVNEACVCEPRREQRGHHHAGRCPETVKNEKAEECRHCLPVLFREHNQPIFEVLELLPWLSLQFEWCKQTTTRTRCRIERHFRDLAVHSSHPSPFWTPFGSSSD